MARSDMRTFFYQVLIITLVLCQGAFGYDFTCVSKTTTETYDGGKDGTVFYLDRQTVDCGDAGVLASFKLLRGPSGTTVYYSYVCCTGSWLSNDVVNGTTLYQDGTEHYYLDKNAANCTYPYQLKSFHVERSTQNTNLWRYSYSCQRAQVGSCQTYYTSYEDSGYNIHYLDRLSADCSAKGSNYVMQGQTLQDKLDKRTWYWRYVYTCCTAITSAPSSRFDYSTIRLQSQDSTKCVTWSDTKSAGVYYPATLGDCKASTGTLWYAQPNRNQTSEYSQFKLFPYPPLAESNFYLQEQTPSGGIAAVGVSAPQSFGVYIDDVRDTVTFPDTKSQLATCLGSSQCGDIKAGAMVATQSYNSALSYFFKASKVLSPLTIQNLGAICENLYRFGWTDSKCPFPPVTGTGGKQWQNDLSYIGSNNLAGMAYPSAFIFYVKEFGSGGEDAGARSLMGGLKIVYNEGSTASSVPKVDINSLTAVTCELGMLEFLVSLQILPVTTGSLDSRGVAGLKWVTSQGNVCSVPSTIKDDPIWSAVPEIKGPDLGNGIPYGAIMGYTTDGYIGTLGFITYEQFQGTLSLPQWSVVAANQMLTAAPNQLSSIVCNNLNGAVSTPCKLTFSLSRANQNTFTKAYMSSDARANSQTFGLSQTSTFTFGSKFETGVPGAKVELSDSIAIGYSLTSSFTSTTTNTNSVTDTTATAVTDTSTTTCSFEPSVPPGHTLTVSGMQTKGNFSIPWSGTFSYILKGGALFNFSSSGEYSAQVETGCYFDTVYTPPLKLPVAARSLATCSSYESCSQVDAGKESKVCNCPPKTYCIPLRYGKRVDRVCRPLPGDNQFNRATSVIVQGVKCNKWHEIKKKSQLDLEYVSKACNISTTCLLEANNDFLEVYGSASSPLMLVEKALGKYLDMGCFYPSRRPNFAKF